MKSAATLFLFAVSFFVFPGYVFGQTQQQSIQWNTNFEKAVSEAKAQNKPLLLFFTGTGWCGPCAKLEKEVFSTPEFANAVGNQFIFVKLDFPRGNTQDPHLRAQNEQLAQKFYIRGYPTVVVLDPDQNQMGTAGYRAGGASAYASYLMKMVNEYTSYKQQMKNVGTQKLSGGQLRHLFDKARALEFYSDADELVKVGMESDQKDFFQTERYRVLAKENSLQDPEAIAIKQELLRSDGPQVQNNAYQIALIEFEVLSNAMDGEELAPELVVAPLLSYLDKFGGQDKENTWRLQMLISQVFLDHNNVDLALRYAQSSYDAAPPKVQPEIASAIRNLSAHLQD